MYHYNAKFVEQLEDVIQDVLLPSHILWCRSIGIDPKVNEILSRLIEAKNAKQEIPFLLKRT